MPYGHPENFQDGSDLPTSDLGTYGLTGELLPTTPDDRGTPGTRPSACPYLTQGTTLPILPAEYRGASFDEDKENVPPGDALSDIDFAEQDIPVTWSNEDIPVRVRQATLGCQDSFAGPDNDEHDWEDELGSMSNLNGAPNRFSHVTQASYADTSDHDSDHDRTSFGASRDPTVSVRPPSRSLVDFAGASGTRHAMTGQLNSPFLSALAALTSTELFQSAKSLLLRKVLSTTKQNDDNEDNLTVDPSQNSSRRDKDDFMQDEMKLETIRQLNPEVFEQAVREVADEVEQEKCGTSESSRRNAMENSRPRTHIPGSYDPSSSFEKAKQMIASRQSGGSQSPTSSTRPLLSGRGGRGGLGFSETRGTFTTQADEDDSTPSFTPAFGKTRRIPIRGRYIPNPGTGTLSFTPSRSRSRDRRVQSPSFVNIPLDGDNRYEMGRIHRIGDGARAAIDSQTSLQPLILTRTTTRRANFDPGHCLTDSELADRERNWSDNPRYGGVTGNVALNIAVRGLEEGRALITPAQAANAETLKEQRDISTRYYLYFMFCPISAAIFGFGYADGIARKVSQGRVSEMHAEDKRHALTVALPLGMIAWGLIGLTMLIVWAVLHH
ncbi:hypothetical protein M433DRAFT_146678 [Acidomyces richmondensis BFW]|nr:MAG: hypothetical protein FE78DRAFT_485849 [Acidomyces sp. 'richmondensis']KYG42566.1 hypothetical protein M433DRAFT_146678 [Acidomyces richmondensis BFW]